LDSWITAQSEMCWNCGSQKYCYLFTYLVGYMTFW